MEKQVPILANDAGGTMTDMMVVDAIAVCLWYSYMNPMHKGSQAQSYEQLPESGTQNKK